MEKGQHAEAAEKLRATGLRPTTQRLAVYEYLLAHRTHPSAEIIYEALSGEYPAFSMTTIYNSLRTLADAGLIRVVTIDAAEQHFDGNPADHGHFRCGGCGQLFDFPIDGQALGGMTPTGFEAVVRDVYMTGLCPACQQTN